MKTKSGEGIKKVERIKKFKIKYCSDIQSERNISRKTKRYTRSNLNKNHQTKREVVYVKEIKESSLQYCKFLLTNRSPKAGYEEILQIT